jgi:hypothetical protein
MNGREVGLCDLVVMLFSALIAGNFLFFFLVVDLISNASSYVASQRAVWGCFDSSSSLCCFC